MPLVNRLKTCTHSSVWMVWCMRVCEAAPCYAHSWMLTSCRKPKFHLDRFVSTRHIQRVEPMHFGCVELVEQHCSTRSSRRARHVERVMSCRDVTWRAKWNLGYTVLGHWAFRWPYCLLRASKYIVSSCYVAFAWRLNLGPLIGLSVCFKASPTSPWYCCLVSVRDQSWRCCVCHQIRVYMLFISLSIQRYTGVTDRWDQGRISSTTFVISVAGVWYIPRTDLLGVPQGLGKAGSEGQLTP